MIRQACACVDGVLGYEDLNDRDRLRDDVVMGVLE